jgi:hypothetical protein
MASDAAPIEPDKSSAVAADTFVAFVRTNEALQPLIIPAIGRMVLFIDVAISFQILN